MNSRNILLTLCFLASALFLIPGRALAQWNTGGDIDQNWVHFGFQLGINANDFIIEKQPDFNSSAYSLGQPKNNAGGPSGTSSGPLLYIQSPYTGGFHLGLLANFRINDNLDLRFTPDVNFSDRVLDYAYAANGTTVAQQLRKVVSSTYLDFPLLLKFKSDRKGNIRAYLIGGFQYSYDIIPSKKTEDAGYEEIGKLVKIQKNALSYRLGLGLDLYYAYFKMSPEVSVSNDLVNVLKPDTNVFSQAVRRLYPTSLQFTLYFE